MIASEHLLAEELAACRKRTTMAQREWLLRQGLGVACEYVAGPLGRGRVLADPDGTFDWAEDGDGEGMNAVICGVFDCPHYFIETGDPDRMPALIDLVAFDPRNPAHWLRRLGTARWLGEWKVEEHRGLRPKDAPPLELFATPLEWLRAHGAGACLLEWKTVYLREELHGVRDVGVADRVLAGAVADNLRKKRPLPPKPKLLIREAS